MLELLLSASPIAALVVVAFSTVAVLFMLGFGTQLVARTLPSKVLQAVETLSEAVADHQRGEAKRDSEMAALRQEFATWVEQMTDLEEAIDKKRRRAAASASRAARAEQEQQEAANGVQLATPQQRLAYYRQALGVGSR